MGYEKYRSTNSAKLREACKTALETEDWERLENSAKIWLKWAPQEADALLYLGESRIQQGDPEGALEALLEIPDNLGEKTHSAYLIAIDLQFDELNKPFDGIATAERLIAVEPTSTPARRRQIYYYGVTMQRDKMISAIAEALRAGAEPPEAYVYLMIADHLSFSNGYQEVSDWLRSEAENETLQIARILQLRDLLDNAEATESKQLAKSSQRTLESLVNKHPENLALFRYQLERAAIEFDFDKLDDLLDSIPPGGEQDSLVLRYRGWYLLQQSQLEASEQALRQSIEIFPLDWHTWNDLAALLRRQGKLQEAEQASEIALEGKDLRKALVQLPSASDLTTELMDRIAKYARKTGDELVAEQLSYRISVLSGR